MIPSELLIATPTDGNPNYGTVTAGYHSSVLRCVAGGTRVLPNTLFFSDDLSRARSRAVWAALKQDSWKWLLFWDDDVVPQDMNIVENMLRCALENGHQWIGAPYPRKRIPVGTPYKPLDEHMTAITKDGARNSSDLAQFITNHCLEVDLLAIGFTMISRECLTAMTEHYRETEWFTDGHSSEEVHETVALFRQVVTPERYVPDGKGGMMRYRELFSEDYSACYRWRQMGGKIQMYLGPASPLMHIGMAPFASTSANVLNFT